MVDWLAGYNPVVQALIGTCFTWFVTAAGAAGVFSAKKVNQKILDGMLGFAAGVMIAASYWSLLAPAIEMAEDGPVPPWVPAAGGFLLGGAVLWAVDKTLPHLHPGFATQEAHGVKSSWRRSTLLVLAVTLHNIPEGLAVGVAFGAAAAGFEAASITGAMALALGIGIQNFPEGLAVSMPLRREGLSRAKSFWWGQFSGFVEPISGVAGAALVLIARPILPYALAFAAGAMIFVVAEDLIPQSQEEDSSGEFPIMGVMFGFTVMMVLDVALG
ncbi:MAG: ZIP family metal transporter [Armatimonadota bacterium]